MFCKTVNGLKAVHYFFKTLHIRSLTGFWIRFWLLWSVLFDGRILGKDSNTEQLFSMNSAIKNSRWGTRCLWDNVSTAIFYSIHIFSRSKTSKYWIIPQKLSFGESFSAKLQVKRSYKITENVIIIAFSGIYSFPFDI